MGIRGLAALLKPYGKATNARGQSVVIDGPALVHRVCEWYMEQDLAQENGVFCLSSYRAIGQAVISWLDELQNNSVNVLVKGCLAIRYLWLISNRRKIFFDGFLPPIKWTVRVERLLQQSQKIRSILELATIGFPRPAGDPSTKQSCKSLDVKPPFLVPAVLEELRCSSRWGSVVEVVPGEADIYCATEVRQHGGILLTTDSDLLVQDLGANGSVALVFPLLPARPPSGTERFTINTFPVHDIEVQLGLTKTGGLARFAFEIRRGSSSFQDILARARTPESELLSSERYQAFKHQFQMQDFIAEGHPIVPLLSKLDPRVSELVVQSLNPVLVTVPRTGSKIAKAPRGPEERSVFLPVLYEDHTKKSAWTMTTSVRQLAYGIAQYSATHQRDRIIEYRTLESHRGGRSLIIPGINDIIRECERMVQLLEIMGQQFSASEKQWIYLAIYYDIVWATEEAQAPLSALLFQEAQRLHTDAYFERIRDQIHFAAQVQASLYSLRVLQQTLEVTALLEQEQLPAPMLKLCGLLRSLPPIAKWPATEEISGVLSEAKKSDVLVVMTNVLGVPVIAPPNPSVEGSRSRKDGRRKMAEIPDMQTRELSPSLNPYAVLSPDSME